MAERASVKDEGTSLEEEKGASAEEEKGDYIDVFNQDPRNQMGLVPMRINQAIVKKFYMTSFNQSPMKSPETWGVIAREPV